MDLRIAVRALMGSAMLLAALVVICRWARDTTGQRISREWPVDSVATVAVGRFYLALLPRWLHALRVEGGFRGQVFVGTDKPISVRHRLPPDETNTHVLSLRALRARDYLPDAPQVHTGPGLGLGLAVKFWKLRLVQLVWNESAASTVLFVDLDAVATAALPSWMGHGVAASVARAWPEPGQCRRDLVVAGERLGVQSPLNTGIFIARRGCSDDCLDAAWAAHQEAKINGAHLNDQQAIVALRNDGTCKVELLPSSTQRYASSSVLSPINWLNRPAFVHFTRAKKHALDCKTGVLSCHGAYRQFESGLDRPTLNATRTPPHATKERKGEAKAKLAPS